MIEFGFINSPCQLFHRNRSSRMGMMRKAIVKCNIKIDPEERKILDTIRLPPRIALTREQDKNMELYDALHKIYDPIEVHELPCVKTVIGEDSEKLPKVLVEEKMDWIVITSPEAASIFSKAWRKANYPTVGKIAAVGLATSEKLKAFGLDVSFIPTKANGKTLVKEFPIDNNCERILYPASAKAANTIVDGLCERGYNVTRLNTYSTENTVFTEFEKELGADVDIVTFAAPSAVKGWISNIGLRKDLAVACIGETSANAARKAGFLNVHYPDKPGIEGWLSAIVEAMKLYDAEEKERRFNS